MSELISYGMLELVVQRKKFREHQFSENLMLHRSLIDKILLLRKLRRRLQQIDAIYHGWLCHAYFLSSEYVRKFLCEHLQNFFRQQLIISSSDFSAYACVELQKCFYVLQLPK